MSRALTINTSRITVLALAMVVAFVGVAALTLAGSMLLPHGAFAASPTPAPVSAPAVCSVAGQISIELADGSTRCVENTCEAVMGADGHADQCRSDKAPLNVSVPDAGSGLSGVAPAATPAAAPATTAAVPTKSTSSGASAGMVLAWAFSGIGVAALLAGAVLLVRQRRRAQVVAEGVDGRRARA